MHVELLYFEGCPHWKTADDRLRTLTADGSFAVEQRVVTTPEDAERVGFRGSPTILVDGSDPFARDDDPTGLACRVFQTPDGPAGSPTLAQLRAVVDAEA